MDCFGLNEKGKCTVLSGGSCEGICCGFHKTVEEHQGSIKKAQERLRNLPEHQQDDIAERYYGGVRKW